MTDLTGLTFALWLGLAWLVCDWVGAAVMRY